EALGVPLPGAGVRGGDDVVGESCDGGHGPGGDDRRILPRGLAGTVALRPALAAGVGRVVPPRESRPAADRSLTEAEALHEELINLRAPRKGHFRFDSGPHGAVWLELAPLYVRPGRLHRFAAELARRLAAHAVEAVCGPLVEGALLAQLVALELDVEFYFAEQFVR